MWEEDVLGVPMLVDGGGGDTEAGRRKDVIVVCAPL